MEYGGPFILVRAVFSSSIGPFKKPPPYSTKQFVIHMNKLPIMENYDVDDDDVGHTLTQLEMSQIMGWSLRHQKRFEQKLFKKLHDEFVANGISPNDVDALLQSLTNGDMTQ